MPEIELKIDLDANVAIRRGRVVELQPQEAELLSVFARARPLSAICHDRLVHALYGFGDPPELAIENVRVRLTTLRRKIRPLGLMIENLWGIGYRLSTVAEPGVSIAA